MTDHAKQTLRRVYGIVLSVLTVLIGALFIIQSQRVYRSAPSTPYSREKAAHALAQIAAPLIFWICAVIAAWIIWSVFPPEEEKPKAKISDEKLLRRLKSRLPLEKQSEAMKKAESRRKTAWIACIVCCVAAVVLTGICVWDKGNYVPAGDNFNPTRDIIAMLPKMLSPVAVAFAALVATAYYADASKKKEITEVKKLLAENKGAQSSPVRTDSQKTQFLSENGKKRLLLIGRIALFVLGVTLIIVGCFNGGSREVLEKAINICTECIGLG